jgi:hypothetical protein
MRAWSNLKIVISLISFTVDNLSINADDCAPILRKFIIVALSALEVKFSTVSEVFNPFTGTTAVLFDGQQFVILNILNSSGIALIERLEIVVEFKSSHVDCALNSTVKLSNLSINGSLTVLDSEVG